MTFLRHLTILLMLLLPLCTVAKDKEHTLSGKIKVKGSDTYPYQLVFEVAHSTIKGYSLTKMPDGSDTKTSIKGLFNKKQHIFIISETKLLSAPQKDVDICFINAVLAYKKKGKNYVFTGFFKGKDGKQNECGEGTIEFIQPITADSLYAEDTARETQPDKSAVKPDLPITIDKDMITAGVDKEFDWHTDSCTIELMDGGIIDGDVVSLLVNDEQVLTKYTLAKDPKKLRFPVTKKINTIAVIAEEEGINPPNTVQLIFHDGSDTYKLTAFNKKGEKATVVIRKK